MRTFAIVWITMTFAALVPACDSAPAEANSRLDRAFQGLCQAESLARDENVSEAERTFADRSHAFLHELADRVQRLDRQAAARLLEAKQRVEAVFQNPEGADPAALAGLIAELEAAFMAAAEVLGETAPACKST